MSVCELAEAVEMEFGHILAVEASGKEQTMSSYCCECKKKAPKGKINLDCLYERKRGRVMNDAWNLGDGLENVCRSVLRKAHYASHQTEEKPRTIINLDAYEITALIWAMNEYIHNGQFAERI